MTLLAFKAADSSCSFHRAARRW